MSLSILKNPCVGYTLLWCFYYLQGILYSSGGILSKLVLTLLIVLSINHMIKCHQQFKLSGYFRGLSILFLAFVVYGLFRTFIDTRDAGVEVASFNFLKNVLISLLPIYSYYYYTKKGYLTEYNLRIFLYVFLAVAIADFYHEHYARMIEALNENSDFTNNSSYLIVGVLPLTVLLNKKLVIQYVVIGIILLYAVMGFKRGALLVAVISVLLIIYESMRDVKKRKKILVMLLSAIVLTYIFEYAKQMIYSSDFFSYRYEKTLSGDASGRENMYPVFFNYFINENSLFSFLFGNGLDATLFIFGNGAHNDWLEIAIDMGIFGLCLYLFYWNCFYKSLRSSKGFVDVHIMLLLVFVADLLKTFFSFSIYNRPISTTCALGYCLAMIALSKKTVKQSKITNEIN